MTTLFFSFIAIVLAGSVFLASLSYLDSTGASASVAADSISIARTLNSGIEFISQYETEHGSKPGSLADFTENGGLPIGGDLPTAQWNLTCLQDGGDSCLKVALCVVLPNSDSNLHAGQIAASHVGATLSGSCGQSDAPDTSVVVWKSIG